MDTAGDYGNLQDVRLSNPRGPLQVQKVNIKQINSESKLPYLNKDPSTQSYHLSANSYTPAPIANLQQNHRLYKDASDATKTTGTNLYP